MYFKKQFFLLYCLFLAFFGHLHAQEYNVNVQQFGIEEGLEDRDVESLFKDSFGFLWIVMPWGLQRYDGYEFKSYNLNIGEEEFRGIHQMGQSESEWLWVKLYATAFDRKNELLFLHPVTGKILTKEERYGQNIAAQLDTLLITEKYHFYTQEGEDHFYFYNKEETVLFDIEQGGIKKIILTPSLPEENNIKDHNSLQIKLVQGNDIWYTHHLENKNKIIKLNIEPLETSIYNSEKDEWILNIREWLNNIYLIGFAGERIGGTYFLYKLNESGKKDLIFTTPTGYQIHEFVDGKIWCIGENGWKVFNLSGSLIFELKRDDYKKGLFEELDYRRIKVDDNGKIYLNTGFGFNIIEINKNVFTKYFSNTEETLSPKINSARGIYVENDSVVVNFEFGSLVVFNKNRPDEYQIVTTKNKDLGRYNGRPLTRSSKGDYWIGHSFEFYKWAPDFSKKEIIYTSKDKLVGINFGIYWSVCEGKDTTIWSGHSTAISHYTLDGVLMNNYEHKDLLGVEYLDVYQITPVGKDILWLTTNNGLYVVNTKKVKMIAHYYVGGKGQYALPASDIYIICI